jgi:MFS family permease
VYDIPSHISSLAFAIVAGLGLALYSPAGNWSDHYGAARVLRSSIGVRGLAYVGLFGLGLIKLGLNSWLALLAFGFVVCAWSLISVSGTTLAAQLSLVGEGEGLGIYNATNALAGVAGAALGGWAAGLWGYNFIVTLAIGGAVLGLILSFLLPAVRAKREKHT